jgi:hypothetical protein
MRWARNSAFEAEPQLGLGLLLLEVGQRDLELVLLAQERVERPLEVDFLRGRAVGALVVDVVGEPVLLVEDGYWPESFWTLMRGSSWSAMKPSDL